MIETTPDHGSTPDDGSTSAREPAAGRRTGPQEAATRSAGTKELAASTRGLTKTYGGGSDAEVHAVRGVDLDLPAGRFTAIMGPSGSGKSTLMHCLAGLDQPSSGTITVAGVALESLDDTALTRFRRDHLGFVFQAFNLLPMLTAGQNILLPLELAGRRVGHAERARMAEVVETLGLVDRTGHLPSQLSGGQQQRVAIARALVAQPQIVFADEPTGNLDSTASAEVLGLLRHTVRALGQTVVMVTHELDAAAYADDVVVIEDGRIASHLTDPTRDQLVDALRRKAA
ncbi:ABC transporter ATP-binding protein [Nocardioides alcanivorans]|uniref:ABC transporter ATP-binding protein n=1 Tax=Nocardioides alcanivorans TaxID=2897352 RepID=UPI001F29C1F6|nr:ABC transporter ATP-binding protein [Nocardioides alcanivorans]